jgi:hypothetical protein
MEWLSLAQMSETVARVRPFSGKCCFQVIYFKPNISSSPPPSDTEGIRVETIWLTRAVKNTWEGRCLRGFNHDLGRRRGLLEAKWS